MERKAMGKIGVVVILGLALLAVWPHPRVGAQVAVAEQKIDTLGSIWIGDHKIVVMIAYQADSALLAAAVPGKHDTLQYIPLMGLTYRGVPSFQLDILSPNSAAEVWIRMSGSQSDVLAHYRFGEKTALTRFGRVKLLDTLFPKHLSGGPLQFPKAEPNVLLLRASFYHYDDM